MAPPSKRIYPSGAAKRALKKRREEEARQMSGSLNTFFAPLPNPNPILADALAHAQSESSGSVPVASSSALTSTGAGGSALASATASDAVAVAQSSSSSRIAISLPLLSNAGAVDAEAEDEDQPSPATSTSRAIILGDFMAHDPSTWPDFLASSTIDFILAAGPPPRAHHFAGYNFPKTNGRSFPKTAFVKIENGISLPRSWLLYSKTADTAYCFCCVIFKRNQCGALSSVGTRDWHHLSTTLDSHVGSRTHVLAFLSWKERVARSSAGKTIDSHHQKMLDAEKERWKRVFFRIVEVVKFLARQSIAFRGTNQRLGDSKNGNFMQLLQTIATFDPIMDEHLRLAMQNKTNKRRNIHYLSSDIQNDLIAALASAILSIIVEQIKESKFYSIIAVR